MRPDQVDTLIDQLEDFVKATIKQWQSNDATDYMIYVNMKESLKEYILELVHPGATRQVIDVDKLKCPDCGSAMRERANKMTGNKFYGCTKFPICKGTRDDNGLSKDERAELKDKSEYPQEDGFSFNKKRQSWSESGPNG